MELKTWEPSTVVPQNRYCEVVDSCLETVIFNSLWFQGFHDNWYHQRKATVCLQPWERTLAGSVHKDLSVVHDSRNC